MATVEETKPELSWADIRQGLKRFAVHEENWAGCPLPLEGLKLVIEPRYPHQGLNGFGFDREEEPEYRERQNALYPETRLAQGIAYNKRTKEYLGVAYDTGKAQVAWRLPCDPHCKRLMQVLDTCQAVTAWDIDAEFKALAKLRESISEHQFKCYVLTGVFVESSPRSKVLYVFRRCRPTLALRHTEDYTLRILAALCLHPIGYYADTYAGCLVPTDDVIAHLMMMRGNERKFWAQANHHSAEDSLGF